MHITSNKHTNSIFELLIFLHLLLILAIKKCYEHSSPYEWWLGGLNIRKSPALPNAEVLVNNGAMICLDIRGVWTCGSLPFVLERNVVLSATHYWIGLYTLMETVEEDPLDAGATSELQPLTGPSAIPSHTHLNSQSYSSSAPNWYSVGERGTEKGIGEELKKWNLTSSSTPHHPALIEAKIPGGSGVDGVGQ